MSHYPTTAELAAFRRAIGTEPTYSSALDMPAHGGAWQKELVLGIGWSAVRPEPMPSRGPIPARFVSESRHEASAMRSREAA